MAQLRIAREKIKKLKQENIILSQDADTAFQDGLNEAQDLYAEQVKVEVKSEAIKEFAERLTDKIFVYIKYVDVDGVVILNRIRRMMKDIEKEMMEVQK